MFSTKNISDLLQQERNKLRTVEDELIRETRRILYNDLLTEKKILSYLTQYNQSFELIDEEEVDKQLIFTEAEIRQTAVKFRLKFLNSKKYKPEIPYEAVLKIKQLNETYRKELKEFRVLSFPETFKGKFSNESAVLFALTNHNNYYLVHKWGNDIHWFRKIRYWPLRSLENLVLTVMAFTLIVTLSLPTALITLDPKATYWCGYRLATYFHLFIFFSGFTAFYAFAFTKNFSGSIWNRTSDFG
jgi:hypothetical protein